MKRFIKSILARCGYRIERISPSDPAKMDPDSRVALTLAASECYERFHTHCPIFQPWLGYGDFVEAYSGVREKTLVSADRCYLLWKMARHALRLPGDFVECGVYRGGTALLLSRELARIKDRRLWLFDSFEGLPDAMTDKGDFYQQGSFSDTSLEAVSALLASFTAQIEMRKGWIPASFGGLDHLRFALAHVDVDLHDPAWECCRFIYPRLVSGGVMIFDDYGYPACRGERTAVDAYFADKNQPVIALPSGQALVIKV